MKKVLLAVLRYLKDWKNLLAHTIVGIGILLIAFLLPITPIYRIAILVAVVVLNTLRMKLDKQKKTRKIQREQDDPAMSP